MLSEHPADGITHGGPLEPGGGHGEPQLLLACFLAAKATKLRLLGLRHLRQTLFVAWIEGSFVCLNVQRSALFLMMLRPSGVMCT